MEAKKESKKELWWYLFGIFAVLIIAVFMQWLNIEVKLWGPILVGSFGMGAFYWVILTLSDAKRKHEEKQTEN